MPDKVELYDGEYGNYESDVYREVRIETYGVDYGQTSWVTTEESAQIPSSLELTRNSNVLEIGCGSGMYALHIAQSIGCRVTGLDINALGIRTANQLASKSGMDHKVRFEVCDVSKPLPFANETFDAVFSNDVLCHIQGRPSVIAEMYRVLKPGVGRMLFSDALIIGGIVSHDEIATRSSIGFYLFSPPGENERLIHKAGFTDMKVLDTTEHAARTAARWHQARQKYKDRLIAAEGESTWAGLQRFLSCVQALTEERRLLRLLYQAKKA
jgi:cyclopropane fatty-acyl-phospholipid synthase-like methyltransferase